VNRLAPVAAGVLALAIAARSVADAPADAPLDRPPAAAAGFQSWLDARPTLVGDPWGLRHTLFDLGIGLDASYYFVVQGNPVGGVTRGVSVFGALNLAVGLDLHRLAHTWEGLSLYASMVWMATNQDLTEDRIGNWNEVNPFAAGDPPERIGLGQLYVQQTLLDEALLMQAGQVYLGSVLNVSPLYLYYLNYAIAPNPGSIFNSYYTFSYNPFGSVGALFKYRFLKRYHVAGGTAVIDPAFARPDNHGINLDPTGDGFASQLELGGRWAIPYGTQDLIGHAWGGTFFNPSTQQRVDTPTDPGNPPPTSSGAYGFYLAADQTFYRVKGPPARSVRGWVNVAWSKPSVTYAPLTVAAGLVYAGPWRERPRDAVAFGVFLTDFGSRDTDLGHQTQDLLLELNYTIVLARWLVVTPDVQFIVNPSGFGTIDDALVLSLMVGVTM